MLRRAFEPAFGVVKARESTESIESTGSIETTGSTESRKRGKRGKMKLSLQEREGQDRKEIFSNWRHATVGWLSRPEMFCPATLPKMQTAKSKQRGVYVWDFLLPIKCIISVFEWHKVQVC